MTYSFSAPCRPSLPWLGLALAFTTVACGGGDERGAADRSGDDPLYLVTTRVWTDSSTTSYIHVVPSLDEGTEVDASAALEVGGAAKLFSSPDGDWFAIGGGESPTITRYTADDHGRLERGETMSLQSYGVHSLWDTLYFVSPDKAYYPDPDGAQLVVWNPETMTITGTVSLPETVREGFTPYYSAGSIRRGDDLLFTVGWFDWETNDSVLAETALVTVTTDGDTVRAVEVDERCGGITNVVEHPSGGAYFASSALASAAHRLGRLSTEPCALRVQAGEGTFDADYEARLAEITGSAVTGEPMPGAAGEVLLRVADESELEVTAESLTYELTGQAVWRWVSWDVETGAAKPLEALAPSTADVFWFEVDGKLFASETTTDYSETTLIEVTPDGSPRRGLTAPGFLQGVARIR